MGLATSEIQKWQVPWDLPLQILKMASPMGLATLDLMKWQVPWDLPLLNSQSGKSHGTCHFRSYEVASPVGLATFEIQKWPDTWDLPYHMLFDIFKMRNGKSPSSWVWFLEVASPKGLAIFRVKKWQVPWQVPFLNYPGNLSVSLFLSPIISWTVACTFPPSSERTKWTIHLTGT